jgi:hypothetical protein
MRTLVYIDGPEVPGALKEWASGVDGHVEWRNGRLFAEPERRVDRVVTDLEGVRAAYESKDVEVVPMPTQKNEASRRRYVTEEGDVGWHKVKDRKTGEYVEGASKRSAEKAQAVADKLNNG